MESVFRSSGRPWGPRRPMHWLLNAAGDPYPCADMREWAASWEDADRRRVALTEVAPGVEVSTVFLGIDHNFSDDGPPLLFESMAFGTGDEDNPCERYATRLEAIAGHDQMVARVRDALAAR